MNNQNNITQPSELLSSQKTSPLPSSIELLKQSLILYKQNLKVFLIIVFLVFFPSFLIYNFRYFDFLKKLNVSTFIFLTVTIIAYLITLVFSILTFYAIIYLIKDSSKKVGLIEAYHQSFNILYLTIWLCFLKSFLTIGAFVFLIIPGIIFSIWFVLGPYVLVNENLKGMNALLKSREYIRGYWWKVFWRLLALGVFFLIVSLVLGFIVNLFLSLLLSKNITNYVNEFMSALIGSFFFSFQIVYTFLIYKNLQSIKGEFYFEPSKKKNLKFIFIGIIGILIFLFLFFYFLSLILKKVSV